MLMGDGEKVTNFWDILNPDQTTLLTTKETGRVNGKITAEECVFETLQTIDIFFDWEENRNLRRLSRGLYVTD